MKTIEQLEQELLLAHAQIAVMIKGWDEAKNFCSPAMFGQPVDLFAELSKPFTNSPQAAKDLVEELQELRKDKEHYKEWIEVEQLKEQNERMTKALEWAFGYLDSIVSVGDSGAFIRGTNTELAGFERALEKHKQALNPPTE